MPQEEHVRQCDQDDFFDQRRSQGLDGMADERAAVIERNNANAFRQAGLHRLNLCFDGVDDIQRVGAVTDDDDAADGIRARPCPVRPGGIPDPTGRCNIFDVDRSAVDARQDDVFDVLTDSISPRPRTTYSMLFASTTFRADIVVAALDRFENVR